MAENSRTEDGTPAAEGAAPAVSAPPAPMLVAQGGPPSAGIPSSRTDVFGIGASAVGHLLIGLLIFGSLSWVGKPPEVIPVKLIPADQAAQKPKPLPEKTSAAQQKQAAAQHRPSPPAKAEAGNSAKTKPSWQDVAAALGMSSFGRKTDLPKQLLADLGAQAKRCWHVPDGWSDPRQVSVTLRFQLQPDGSLAGDPAVVEFPATPIGAAAAKSAMDAVRQCGPYRLPAAQYEQWKDIQLELAP